MPLPKLPLITREEIHTYNSKGFYYMTLNTKVYDVTEFISNHPGGADVVRRYAGHNVEQILKDPASHPHSDTAYEILDDFLIGILAPNDEVKRDVGDSEHSPDCSLVKQLNGDTATSGQLGAGVFYDESLHKDTDYEQDYKEHKFLDLRQPLFSQLWFGGFSKDFYLDQIHRPRHYKSSQSAALFGNFLEPLSKTSWWVIPILWIPCVIYGTLVASRGFDYQLHTACYWLFGVFFWSIIEYTLHRFLFHLDYYLPDNRLCITAHFLLHGIHHYLPMDKSRLVMPPALFVILATPFWYLAHAILSHSWHGATATYCGGVFGYICYDITHYSIHHFRLPLWYRRLKRNHLAHHFLNYELGFGVTTTVWDTVFGTQLQHGNEKQS